MQEFDSGTTSANFVVSLSNPSASTLSVNYATVDGSATGGSDFQTTSGTLTFNPGELSRNISVSVNGDLAEETTETFFMNLAGPVNARLADAQGVGTIADDDSSCPAPNFNTAPTITLGSGFGPFSLAKADFNTDGKVDLASANIFANNVSILLGNGTGGFASPANFAVGEGPHSIAVGDFNLDNKADLITANEGSSSPSGISVLLGDGAGGFAPAVTTNPGVPVAVAVAVGDLNLDGKPDIAVVSVSVGKVFVLLGNGSGGFGTATGYTVGTSPVSVALADLNNDGKLDAAVANRNSDSLSVLLGKGDGTLLAAVNVSAGQNPRSVAAGDFNGDGKTDMAIANSSQSVSLLMGNGAGGFLAGNSLSIAHDAVFVSAADFNGDGKLDLVVPNSDDQFANGFIAVFFGNGTGGFSVPTEFTVAHGPIGVVAGDFNGDGTPEPAVANLRSDSISIFLNACSAAQPPPTVRLRAPNLVAGEGAGSVIITVDRTGNTQLSSSIDYSTSDDAGANHCDVINGKASSRCDYLLTIGTLRFAAHEISKTISIPIIDDSYAEGNESFTVALSNAIDANPGSPSTTTVTINDNESVNGSNPIDFRKPGIWFTDSTRLLTGIYLARRCPWG